MIATGTSLLALPNPFALFAAYKLIELGKQFVELGNQYSKIGSTLIKISNNGEDNVNDASRKISITGQILESAIKKVRDGEEIGPDGESDENGEETQDGEEQKDDAQKSGGGISGITAGAKKLAKSSEKNKKDSDKSEQDLKQESATLQRQMNKEKFEALKLGKESAQEVKNQAKILARYEQLVAENEGLVAFAENKQNNAQSMQPSPASGDNNPNPKSQPSADVTAEQAQLNQNNALLNELDTKFNKSNKIIANNTKRIKAIEKSTRTHQKKFEKVNKTIQQKEIERQKEEEAKQKELEKDLAIVGVANDVFSITMATGSLMMLIPVTAAAGNILFQIGLYGIIACGIAEGTIDIANGKTEEGLMAFGKTLVTAAASMVGAGEAANGVFAAVSAGSSIVGSSASLTNNVRTIEGKEKSETAQKVQTVAGITSSMASVGASMGDFKSADIVGKGLKITNAVGAVTTATGQIMSMVNPENETAATVMQVGAYISMAAAAATVAKSSYNNLSTRRQNIEEAMPSTDNGEPTAAEPVVEPVEEPAKNNNSFEDTDKYFTYSDEYIQGSNVEQPSIETQIQELEQVQVETQVAQEQVEDKMQIAKDAQKQATIEAEKQTQADANSQIQQENSNIENTTAPENNKPEEKKTNDEDWLTKGMKIVGEGLQYASTLTGKDDENTQVTGIEKTPFDYEMSDRAKKIVKDAKRRVEHLRKLQYKIDTFTV